MKPTAVEDVKAFWQAASCGEEALLRGTSREDFEAQSKARYVLEPFIETFADFNVWRGKSVLEVGVGLGADHQRFAEAGARMSGIDLTERAVEHTHNRLTLFDLSSDLKVGNAEALPYAANAFDLVYSWGVIHHSPNTQRIVDEIFRVLKPGGVAKIMIYNYHSLVGYMLWFRYALARLHPLMGLDEVYATYLESPGTKAYTPDEAKLLFRSFRDVTHQVFLTHGDLLSSHAGQRHQGAILDLARLMWPRRLLQRIAQNHGLFLTIQAIKP